MSLEGGSVKKLADAMKLPGDPSTGNMFSSLLLSLITEKGFTLHGAAEKLKKDIEKEEKDKLKYLDMLAKAVESVRLFQQRN